MMRTSKQRVMNRRSLLKAAGAAGSGIAAVAGVGLLSARTEAAPFDYIKQTDQQQHPAADTQGISAGDAAILRFLAAAEILETDAWQQYNELGGVQDAEVPGGSGSPAYAAALAVLDEDMAQYIHDNT